MSALAKRIAVTVLAPAAMVAASEYVLLPGVSSDFVRRAQGSSLADLFRAPSQANLGVFALGVAPLLSAYWLVEVVAFLVPRWSRLRHGNPEGRAKLERAAIVVALALAVFQGFGVATQLQALEYGSAGLGAAAIHVSIPVVIASLVAGVCVQFVVARLVTQHGLVNGFVALFGASQLYALVKHLPRVVYASPPRRAYMFDVMPVDHDARSIVLALAGTIVIVASTIIALRSASAVAAGAEDDAGSPYRSARRLAVAPSIPVPAGSFQPYFFASSLLTLPAVLAGLHVPLSGLASELLANDVLFTFAFGALIAIITVVFARLMHRPAELASLVERVGGKAGPDFAEKTKAAIRAAIGPTLLFFLVLLVGGYVSRLGVVAVVLLVPIAMDVVHGVRIAKAGDRLVEWVPIWDERRITAVPILRAALAEHGIATEVQGASVLAFWQVFAPYAPARILAHRADAERAEKTLRWLLVGGEEPAREGPPLEPAPAPAILPRRRLVLLGACLAAVAVLAGVALLPRSRGTHTNAPRAKLEIVRIDDTLDPFASVADGTVPEGIDLRAENVPAGDRGTIRTTFARVVMREGESKAAAATRLRAWLARVALPEGARFGLEDVTEYDPETTKATVVGVRTYLLVGPAELGTDDIVDANAAQQSGPMEQPYVAVELSPAGATRFEALTAEWTNRRLALVVNDEINSAPVVRERIRGGRMSLTTGGGDPEKRLAEARRLADSLRPR